MTSERALIVNADDFGLTPGVNAGIARTHENGILTSASLMVRWPAAEAAAEYAARNPRLAVGLHADLGEWVFRNARWEPVYRVVDTDDAEATERELRAQVETFRELIGRDPTHIDSHQHVHNYEPNGVFIRLARELGIPLRAHDNAIKFRNFYGRTKKGSVLEGRLSVETLIGIIAELGPGTTELGVHPGLGDDTGSIYEEERELEVEILCDPRLPETLEREGVALRSFADIASDLAG